MFDQEEAAVGGGAVREGGDGGGGGEQGLGCGVYYVVGEVVEDGGLGVG